MAELFAQGLISEEKIGKIISEAARSDVGKKKTFEDVNDDDEDDDSDDIDDKKGKKKKKRG